MQDNFSFNRTQVGSSLFMKSDHDGVNDAHNKNMPLGIKTVGEGLEHFSDWESTSDVLQQQRLANFEDSQPRKIKFSQNDKLPQSSRLNIGENTAPQVIPGVDTSVSFEDSWNANKVKVYDSMAFVAYDEYTDLHRVDIELTDSELRQYLSTADIGDDYDHVYTRTDVVGTLALKTDKLPLYDNVAVDNSGSTFQTNTSIDFASYQNSILKVEFSGTVNRGSRNLSGDSNTQQIPKVGYFVFGGALKNDLSDRGTVLNTEEVSYNYIEGRDNNRGILSNGSSDLFSQNIVFDDTDETDINILRTKLLADNNNVIGKFFIVVNNHVDDSNWGSAANDYKVDSNNGTIGIQLSIQSNWGSNQGSPNNLTTVFPYTMWNDGVSAVYFNTVDTTKITLIKVQPVRKCGKVDIYVKKHGIVGSLLDSNYEEIAPTDIPKFPPVGGEADDTNIFSSNGHSLKTNDIVEISGALLDYDNHTGIADTHPLNGLKYVKVISDNIFELYDDKFFEDPVTTVNLRTVDGIIWKCVSNNFDSIGQSWDYYGTLFSPTGRNGYKFVDSESVDVSDSLASSDEFFTNKRLISIDDSLSSEENEASITLRFDGDYGLMLNSDFGEQIDKKIPKTFGDHSSGFDTPLNDVKRAFWDFYPYNCQDDQSVSEVGKSPYWGSRFGCDLDVKFSHKSGSSSVYTLAVGERGSDVSVDIHGFFTDETHYDVKYSRFSIESYNHTIAYNYFRKRIIPWSLPHGKTHLFQITVDQYGKISDISHVNSLYGGGKSIVDNSTYDQYREINPSDGLGRSRYRENCLYNIRYYSPSRNNIHNLQTTISTSDLQNNTGYWLRSAVVHWIGHSIPEYRVNSNDERDSKFLRQISAPRETVPVQADNVNYRSRFGEVGFGGPFTPYNRIDWGVSPVEGFKRTYIYQWVDSFGKSVVINTTTGLTAVSGYSDSDPKVVVMSASTSRSNIETGRITSVVNGQNLESRDTRSEIGQIQANFVYSNGSAYTNIDHIFINSGGGDCDRLFTNLTTRDGKRVLKDGSYAGYGMSEVITSCSLSALHLEWFDNKLIWVDQELYKNLSRVHVFNFNDRFSEELSFTHDYIDDRENIPLAVPSGKNTGDGFGIYFRYEDDIFVTNARSKYTDLGSQVSLYLDNRDRMDLIHVYENLKDSFVSTQKISATIDKSNEDFYPLYLLNNEDGLLDLQGVANYDNNSVNCLTWDIDFKGRYDLVSKKILIKDPLEYSLFSRDFSIGESYIGLTESSDSAEPYLGLIEKTKITSRRSSNELTYEYIPDSEENYYSTDKSSASSYSKLPFIFYKLPIDNLDVIKDLVIEFDLSDTTSYISLKQDLLIGGVEQTIYSNTIENFIPRIVLYSRDPRMTIVENGPNLTDTEVVVTDRLTYTNGIWDRVDRDQYSEKNDQYSYEFPGYYRGGARDMFFYGRLPGSHVKSGSVSISLQDPKGYLYGGEKNLGDYYDLTTGSRLGGNAGDPAWVAPDVFSSLSANQQSKIIPYSKIFRPTSIGGGRYRLTLIPSDYKDLINSGNLIRDTGRSSSIVSGFNDTSNKYSVDNIEYSLIIGFYMTNINNFDINNSLISSESILDGDIFDSSVGPIRYILSNDDGDNYVNARYPYCGYANLYDSSSGGMRYNGKFLDYNLNATIPVDSVSVRINKVEASRQRYKNNFHKVAVFSYDQDAINDAQEVYRTRRTASEKDVNIFKSFGYNTFIPLPNYSNHNSIIAISKTSNGFTLEDDHEVLNSENISFNDTSYYIDNNSGGLHYTAPPTGEPIGQSSIGHFSLLGGFDLDKDKYLSLYMNTDRSENELLKLVTKADESINNDLNLNVSGVVGIESSFDDMSLRIGVIDNNIGASLFTYAPEARPLSLYIDTASHADSGVSLFTSTTHANNDITLTFAHPFTGGTSLYTDAQGSISGSIDNYIFGVGLPLSDIPVFVSGLGVANNDVPLYIKEPSSSGLSTLYIRNIPASGFLDLTLPKIKFASGMPLHISQYYFGDIPLYSPVIDYSSGDVSLNVVGSLGSGNTKGPIDLFIGKSVEKRNRDLALYTLNDQFAQTPGVSGSFVKQDLFLEGSVKVLNSGAPLYIDVPASDSSFGDLSLYVEPFELYNNDHYLFLKSQNEVDVSGLVSLHIRHTESSVSGIGIGGGVLSSGDAPLFMRVEYNNNIPSFVYSADIQTNFNKLYVHRTPEFGMSLNVSSFYDSGNISVYTSGANVSNNSTSLYVMPPESSGIDMFTRGYLE